MGYCTFYYRKQSNKKVLYVTSETFTNELIDAIRNKENAKKAMLLSETVTIT
ncbi:MAG: DnaA ATPase domain-containing protein [Lachnospira pectinoschiza]